MTAPRSIGFYVHHHGSGHLHRAVQIAAECDDRVTGLSSLPRPDAWPGEWVELPLDTDTDVDTDSDAGHGADLVDIVEADAGGALHWAPLGSPGYATRMRLLAEWIGRERPDLLYVDVSVEVALLTRLLGVPVAVASMRGTRDDAPHRAAYDAARVILAPWPAAAPEPARRAAWDAKTVHTGAISRFDAALRDAHHDDTGGRGEVAADATMSRNHVPEPGHEDGGRADGKDGDGRGDATLEDGEQGGATAPGAGCRRVALLWGRGGGAWSDDELAQVRAATPGWEWEVAGRDRDVWSALTEADVVVTHAGQNAVAEVAAARRCAVVVPLERPFGEQAATAAALRAAGLAVTTDDPGWTTWPAGLDAAGRSDGRRWSLWSDGRGAYRAARTLEAAARGRCLAPGVALVTLVHGRHGHLRGLLAGLAAGTHLPERVVVVALGDPDVRDVVARACRGTGLSPDVVDVPSTPEGLPLARARNVGAATARRLGCRTLVFLDVDCIPGGDLVRRYADAVLGRGRREDDETARTDTGAHGTGTDDAAADARSADGKTADGRTADGGANGADGGGGSASRAAVDASGPRVWSGPTTYLPPAGPDGYDLTRLADLADPHPARPAPPAGEQWQADDLRLFWSLSFAMSADDFDAVGGFCEEYRGYGGEDTDFAMRLGAAGGSLYWLGGADAFHQHHPTHTPPTHHLADIVRNANLFAATWGRHPMEGWLAAFAEAGLARYDEGTRRWEVCDA